MKILTLQNYFGSSLRAPEGDLNDCLLDRENYSDFQIEAYQLFPAVYFAIFGDNHCVLDVTAQQIYLIRNGRLKIIAGQYGIAGLRDGPGNQAILGAGGFQEAFSTVTLANGDFLWTDTKTQTIRRAHEETNGAWTISTFASYDTTSLANDSNGNIYTVQGSTLIQILPGGGTKNFALPWGNILSIQALNDGRIVLLTRNNAYDIVFDYDPATGASNRLCGINGAEMNAYCAHVGITADQYFATNHDGPALGVPGVDDLASFHSPTFAYVAPDGSEIWLGGSDERQVRRWLASTGRVDSLLLNGTWAESTVRTRQEHNQPWEPMFAVAPFGKTPDGYFWEGGGQGHTSVQIAVLTEVVIPPPEVNVDGYLDAIIDNKTAWGWAVNNGQHVDSVEIRIDGVAIANAPMNFFRQDINDAYHISGNNGFSWDIPAQFGDGQAHSLAVFCAGVQLTQSPKTFVFQVGGTMQKTLGFQIEQQEPPNAAEQDHFKVVVDGVSQSVPLTATSVTLEFAAGHHIVDAQVANAADAYLVPPAHLEFDVAPAPTAPVIVSISLS